MAERPSGASRMRRWVATSALLGALFALIALPISVAGAPIGATLPAAAASPSADGVTGVATWNGVNVAQYSSTSSSAHVGLNGVVDVRFNWSSGQTPYTIANAWLQVYYLGFVLDAREVVQSNAGPATSGSFTMNWTTGTLQYIIAGSYRMEASLQAPNGTTEWSQSFYVNIQAPYYVLALFPILLIVIAIWEVYSIATLGSAPAAPAAPSTAPKPPPAGETP